MHQSQSLFHLSSLCQGGGQETEGHSEAQTYHQNRQPANPGEQTRRTIQQIVVISVRLTQVLPSVNVCDEKLSLWSLIPNQYNGIYKKNGIIYIKMAHQNTDNIKMIEEMRGGKDR